MGDDVSAVVGRWWRVRRTKELRGSAVDCLSVCMHAYECLCIYMYVLVIVIVHGRASMYMYMSCMNV